MLDREFKYFTENKEELTRKYQGKYIVIVGEKVVGVFDSDKDAYINSIDKFKLGEFLIQYCDAKEGSYTQTFHSRVSFV